MRVQKVVVTIQVGEPKMAPSKLGFTIETRQPIFTYTVHGILAASEQGNATRMERFQREIAKYKGHLSLHGEKFVVSYQNEVPDWAENAGTHVLSAGNYAFEMALPTEQGETADPQGT